jgi:hypothetical protein
MTTPDIDQAYLVTMFGASTIARYFDTTGSGSADAATVAEFCAIATATAHDCLIPFRVATSEAVKTHERYKRIVAIITLGERTMSKTEWMMPNGRWPYEQQKNEAKAELVQIAKGIERMAPEATSGSNPMLRSSRRPSTRELMIAPSEKNPNGGGRF